MTVDLKRKQTTLADFFGKRTKKVKVTESSINTELDASDEVAIAGIIEKPNLSLKQDSQAGEPSVSDMSANQLFQRSLSNMLRQLLALEIESIDSSWFTRMEGEFRKPYFVKLKQFINAEKDKYTVFPPPQAVYSWTRLTPFDQVRVVIIGQDPYHNFNQAHGLAFSVKPPTAAPPSLKNIYKELKNNYSDFVIDNNNGDLTPWSVQGVLLLNTALTVRAHNANSHSKKGWETFTKRVVEALLDDRKKTNKSLIFLIWGNNAIKLVDSLLDQRELLQNKNLKVLKSVHPSPLSASRGFFGSNHFKQTNDWLHDERHEKMIDWSVVPGSHLKEVQDANCKLSTIDRK